MDVNNKEQIVQDALDYSTCMSDALEAIEIDNQGALDAAGSVLVEIKQQAKDLEQKRTEITKPLNEAKKKVDSLFKPAKDALKKCEVLLKGKITGFIAKQEADKIKALEDGDHATALATVPAVVPSGVMVKSSPLKYRITDLDDVPRAYLTLDHSAIKILMKEHGEALTVPGIEFYRDQVIAVGGKK